MIKDDQAKLNRFRLLLDALTITGAYFLTYWLFFFVIPPESPFGGSFSVEVSAFDYRFAVLYIGALTLAIYGLLHLYAGIRFTGRRLEALRIFEGNLVAIVSVVVFFWLFIKTYSLHFSRMFLFEFGVINTFLMVLQRNLLRIFFVNRLKKEANLRRVLLVGFSKACEAFLDRVKVNARWGYSVCGILDDRAPVGTAYGDYKVIGKISDLESVILDSSVDEVYVTLRLQEYEKLEEVVRISEKAGAQTKFVPDYGNLMSNRPFSENLLGLPVIYLRQVPLDDLMNAFLKRAVDIIGSLAALVLFSPVMLVTALLVKCTSKGPVIFRQERIGLHRKPFRMYKFRSMTVQKSEDEEKEWTTKDDPRVMKVGSFIRKTSIDELPQLFNVLLGDMSLVGPRPERPQFVEIFREEIPRYMVKHQVRPGMTGWAQVNGLRGDTSIEKRIEYDIYYIENWTMGFDFRILFLTVFKGFVNKNAY
ncbi:MAG: undecaprenyl-phosphate glucose phosphotransferase [Lachnospiraceae bacterium]|nr:undecaprenyl-phosphate glucose phosphotransferase [Lachnospiraceae bacterium]